jgi:hypothetical protein
VIGFQKYYFFNLESRRLEWESPGITGYGEMGWRWMENQLIIERGLDLQETLFFLARLDGHPPNYLFRIHESCFSLIASPGRFIMIINASAAPIKFRCFDVTEKILGQPREPLPPRTWLHSYLPIPGEEGFAIPCGQTYSATSGILLARLAVEPSFRYMDFHGAFSDALKATKIDADMWKTEAWLGEPTACMRDRSTLRFLAVSHGKSAEDTAAKWSVWDYNLSRDSIQHVADLTIPISDRRNVLLSPSGNWVLALAEADKQDTQAAGGLLPLSDGFLILQTSAYLQRVGENTFEKLPIALEYEPRNMGNTRVRVRFLNDTELVYLRFPYEIRKYSISERSDELLYSHPGRSRE